MTAAYSVLTLALTLATAGCSTVSQRVAPLAAPVALAGT